MNKKVIVATAVTIVAPAALALAYKVGKKVGINTATASWADATAVIVDEATKN